MFNIVEKNQKLVKGIMITVGASFVIWGVGGYLGMGADDGYLAKVGSQKIYQRDLDQALQSNPNQQNQDKVQVLMGLVSRQLLLNYYADNNMVAPKEALQKEIAAIPAFQNSKGQFDLAKYEEFLKSRYITAEDFQKDIGQQVLLQQTVSLFQNSYFTSKTFKDKFADLLSQERNVSSYVMNSSQFADKVQITESQVAAYYQQNIARYTLPEKVKLQYLVLDSSNVASKIQVSDAEVTKYMTDHPSTGSGEQIDVSHILFTVPQDADAKTRADAKARAEKVLAQVQANPNQFAALAKEYSQDPGSAKNGGDLGFFGRGAMVKPFEDAAFNLKVGQVSGIVETQYGYHILKLNKIKTPDQAELKKNAIADIQKQRATLETQKQLEQLNDITYNQAQSLDPAAKKLGLQLQTSDWVSKGDVRGDFANPKIQKAIFTADVTVKKNNSEVVDLGDGKYGVYRVVDYQKAQVQDLKTVAASIKDMLKQQKVAEMTVNAGQFKLTEVQQGKAQVTFSNPTNVNMVKPTPDFNYGAVQQIFSAPTTKLPSYVGTQDAKGNYVIYKINSVSVNKELVAQNAKNIDQMAEGSAMLDMNAYITYLRSKYSVDMKLDRLQQQQQQSQ